MPHSQFDSAESIGDGINITTIFRGLLEVFSRGVPLFENLAPLMRPPNRYLRWHIKCGNKVIDYGEFEYNFFKTWKNCSGEIEANLQLENRLLSWEILTILLNWTFQKSYDSMINLEKLIWRTTRFHELAPSYKNVYHFWPMRTLAEARALGANARNIVYSSYRKRISIVPTSIASLRATAIFRAEIWGFRSRDSIVSLF